MIDIELTEKLLIIGGIIFALILYPKTQFEKSYEDLNNLFLHFLEMQIDHPTLGTNVSDKKTSNLSPEQKARQDLMFDYLSSLHERAFYFLNDGIDKFFPWKRREWKTWEHWILRYGQNPNYLEFWLTHHMHSSYGEKFVAFIRKKFGLPEPGKATLDR